MFVSSTRSRSSRRVATSSAMGEPNAAVAMKQVPPPPPPPAPEPESEILTTNASTSWTAGGIVVRKSAEKVSPVTYALLRESTAIACPLSSLLPPRRSE